MPRNKKAVPAAADASYRTLRPPTDMWERLEAARLKAVKESRPSIPECSFTAREYAKARGVTGSTACVHLRMLLETGKLQKLKIGKKFYYFEAPVDDAGAVG